MRILWSGNGAIVNKTSLIEPVTDFFNRHQLLGTGGVLALSGGPDSVCLAKILRDLHGQGSIPRLVLAHLNHQLRGADSDGDEEFVVKLAHAWGLPCRTQRLDVAAAARQSGANLEDTARQARYDWLTQVAREEGAIWVATGHSADDQAETILFRLLRGSGLQGLAGMAERRVLAPGIDLIRPLLSVRRHAIQAYLDLHEQCYRQDASNQDRHFTRNRLRHELLPLLASQFNPAIAEVLCRLGEQAREAQEELARWAARLLAEAELPRAGGMVVLDAAKVAGAAPHMRRELFRLVWQREQWPMAEMTFEAWDRLARLVEGTPAAQDLQGGVRARRTGRVVQVERI
jgi:tRNA(Ile)-lysidine synthase